MSISELREKHVDDIYSYLYQIVQIAQNIKYLLIIGGDFNNISGDHNVNKNGMDNFLPFVQGNNLQIINVTQAPGQYTFHFNGRRSIIDYILVNDIIEQNNTISIPLLRV